MTIPRSAKQLNIRVRDNRRIEFFMLPNDLIDHHASSMSVYALAVYVALCRYASSGSEAQISYTTLCKKLGIARTTLSRALIDLRSLRYLSVEPTTTVQGRGTNVYVIERLPVVSPSPLLTRESTNATNPSSADGLTLVAEMDDVKEELNKDIEPKEPSPNLKRIQEWSRNHNGKLPKPR